MNLLFVSNFYPPYHIGGYEMLCHEVATHLQAQGHRVRVLTSTYKVTSDQQEPDIYRKLRLEGNIYYYRPQQIVRYWTDRRSDRRAIVEVMSATKPDVVIVWGMWSLSPQVAEQVEKLAGAKVIYYLANLWPAEPTPHEAYWSGPANSPAGKLFKRIFSIPIKIIFHKEWRPYKLRFERVITCSESVRTELLKAGIPIHHAQVIYHGIDPAPYQMAAEHRASNPRTDMIRAVYVGALVPHKGVHTAVEAVGRLAQSEPSITVTLSILGAGHPEYESYLHEMVTRWHLEDRVVFHRPIPRVELPAFLAQYDVLLMPSVWEEPQARISQEAMAAGLVLVATLTGGTKEILVDGVNGLGFKAEDAESLAQHLHRLARDPELRARLIRAGQRTVTERFTITRMIQQFEDYLMAVAGKR